MTHIPESELILNKDGSVYHLHLRPEQIANTIITVGDPDRVSAVSKHFDRIDTKVQKREFVTHTGELNGQRISVISTGIGTDNIDIVLNELDALVNIDLKTRVVKTDLTSLNIIRIGTSGCLQKHIPVDSFLVSSFAIGFEGLLHYYNHTNNADEILLQYHFMNFCGHALQFPIRPYFAQASKSLAEKVGDKMLKGITATCSGFYAPQTRSLRLPPSTPELLDTLAEFEHDKLLITNFEMETAGIYGLARMLGHEAVSCNALLANRATQTFSTDPSKTVERLIKRVLERI